MIPSSIKIRHIRSAIAEIDAQGVPRRRESYRYDLKYGERRYPPKLVISIAAKYSEGKEFNRGFNAVEAKNWFKRHSFEIVEKSQGREIHRILIAEEDEESNFAEGQERYRLHRSLERDQSIVKAAKRERVKKVGELRCDVCQFSFTERYGELGAGYIEAHHTVPVSSIRGKHKTRLSDIALVCSNCHRMLHRSRPMKSIIELRQEVAANL